MLNQFNMDCLRSFSINSSLNQSWALGPNFDTWTIGTDRYWFGRTTTAFAQYNIQGFKNVNIYGIDVIGDFKSGPGGSQVIIDNWEVNVDLIGLPPLLGGQTVPAVNSLNVNTDIAFINRFIVSKYKRAIQFESPIESVTEIRFDAYTASGHANQSLLSATVNWNLNYVFYYLFEGE